MEGSQGSENILQSKRLDVLTAHRGGPPRACTSATIAFTLELL